MGGGSSKQGASSNKKMAPQMEFSITYKIGGWYTDSTGSNVNHTVEKTLNISDAAPATTRQQQIDANLDVTDIKVTPANGIDELITDYVTTHIETRNGKMVVLLQSDRAYTPGNTTEIFAQLMQHAASLRIAGKTDYSTIPIIEIWIDYSDETNITMLEKSLEANLPGLLNKQVNVVYMPEDRKRKKQPSSICSWPELVGRPAEEAKATILAQNPGLTVFLVNSEKGAIMTMDYRLDRVRIFHNSAGVVTAPPTCG